MSTRLAKRVLRFESLQQRLLLTANQTDTGFDAGPVMEDTVLKRAMPAADSGGPALNGAVVWDSASTGESLSGQQQIKEDDVQERFHLENGDAFILDTPSSGRLVTPDGAVTAYRNVDIVSDVNRHGCDQDEMCWTTRTSGSYVRDKDRIGEYRDNIVDQGDGTTNFDMMIIFGEPSDDPADVSGDGHVTPRDLLILINDINARGSRQLDRTSEDSDSRVDVSGDGWFSPIDVLLVINALKRQQESEVQQSLWPESNQNSEQLDPAIPLISETPNYLPAGPHGSDLSIDVTGSGGTPQCLTQWGIDRSASTQATVQLSLDSLPAIQIPRTIEKRSYMEDSRTADDFWAQNIDEIFAPLLGCGPSPR